MMKLNNSLILLLILIVGLACLITPTFSQNNGKSRSAEDNKLLKEFRDLAVKEGGIIEFKSLTETKKFLNAKNRPYEVLALFTSSNPRYGCPGCLTLKNNILAFEESYVPYLESSEFLEKPVFIVVLEVDTTLEFFQQVGLSTIPHLVFIPSGSKPIQPKGYSYTRFDQVAANHISDFIYSHSNIRIKPVKSFYEEHSRTIFAVIIAIASLRFLLTAWRKRKSPMFWYFLTILLFAAVIMGIFYDFIHKPALFEFDYRTQKFNYFSRGSRSQTIAEGFIMGVSTLAITLVFIYISDILPNYSSFGNKTKSVLFFTGMTAILAFLYFQSQAFAIKYYRPLFFIPTIEY